MTNLEEITQEIEVRYKNQNSITELRIVIIEREIKIKIRESKRDNLEIQIIK